MPSRPVEGRGRHAPTLIVFDCLYAGGKDLRPRRGRRNVLEEIVNGHILGTVLAKLAAFVEPG